MRICRTCAVGEITLLFPLGGWTGSGQTRSLQRCPLHDRSSPESGSPAAILLCRIRAMNGLAHRSTRHGYSITLSASASTAGGIVRLSVLAVIRLEPISKLPTAVDPI